MQLFYTPDITENIYTLNEQESKHCVKVLRKQKGDTLYLTNGTGTLYKAEVVDVSVKSCQLHVVEVFMDYERRDFNLHVAIAPTKNIDRIEWFLEKTTEIGIDQITPLICEHSERKVIKPERLERVIVAAMKQSLKAYKPVLNPLVSFNEFIHQNKVKSGGYIAHCQPGDKALLKTCYTGQKDIIVLIGPEGDFSVEEVGLAVTSGYESVSLGEARLRTETAGLVACHTINLLNQ